MSDSFLPRALFFRQQQVFVPQVTATLCLIAMIIHSTLVAEVCSTTAFHVIAAMCQLNHVPVYGSINIAAQYHEATGKCTPAIR